MMEYRVDEGNVEATCENILTIKPLIKFPGVLYKEIMSTFGTKIEQIIIEVHDSMGRIQILSKEFRKNDFLIIVKYMSKIRENVINPTLIFI